MKRVMMGFMVAVLLIGMAAGCQRKSKAEKVVDKAADKVRDVLR